MGMGWEEACTNVEVRCAWVVGGCARGHFLSGVCVPLLSLLWYGKRARQSRCQGRAGRAGSSWRVVRADKWTSSTAEWDNAKAC